ncbi:unnamed protein product, partial [Ectocarpus sp. 8 AP-2014]
SESSSVPESISIVIWNRFRCWVELCVICGCCCVDEGTDAAAPACRTALGSTRLFAAGPGRLPPVFPVPPPFAAAACCFALRRARAFARFSSIFCRCSSVSEVTPLPWLAPPIPLPSPLPATAPLAAVGPAPPLFPGTGAPLLEACLEFSIALFACEARRPATATCRAF